MEENETKPESEPIKEVVIPDNAFISAFDLKKATKITMFEKICLWFIKPKTQVDQIEKITMQYKIFRGRIYILKECYPAKY